MPPSAANPGGPSTSRRTPSSTSDRPLPPKRVEDDEVKPYVIVSDLGKGSFATVYRGYHEHTHQQVAIKTVNRSGLSPKLFDNLQGEIEILKTLSHRHVTRLIDIVRAERNIYLIIEFCAGGDLSNYIKKRGRVEGLEYVPSPGSAPTYYVHPRTGGLDEIVVRSFLRQLARALKFLRHRNLIHRDIKPQNLLLNPASPDDLARGHPLGVPILKVADFGFARSLPQAMMAETLCGSPLYMAPEILRYEKYDAKADLWSVGAVLYEMAVGRPPFRAQNHIELLKKIDSSRGVKFPDEDPRIAAAAANGGEEVRAVPADIKKLIRTLLRRLPAERASFEEFFGSTALANSKFPRPREPTPPRDDHDMTIPQHHLVIPPEVLDPKAMIPPSKFHFRRRESAGAEGSPSDRYIYSFRVGSQLTVSSPMRDGTGTGVAEVPRSPPPRSPHFSPPTQSTPLSADASLIPGETEEDGMLRREYVLVGDRRAVEINRVVDEMTARRRPLRDRERKAMPSPLSDDLSTEYPVFESPSPTSGQTTFPPPPNPNAPPLSGSPSSAGSRTNPLTRALNLASKKLFEIISGRGLGLELQGERDPAEDQLLGSLEELAQKTEVLTHWADEMYDYVKAFPKPLPDPNKFLRREGEPERLAARRKNADIQAEYNAMTCVALYMLLMSFSQKGIDRLRNHHEHMQMRDPDGELEVSEGFDAALSWFKDHFIKCHDRAALVKTWLPAQYTGPPTFLDQLVYDRALVLVSDWIWYPFEELKCLCQLISEPVSCSERAVRSGNIPDECEKLYEESLWCLYALQDDLLQTDNPFMEEDHTTISMCRYHAEDVATWIKRTKLRLVRCRVRMGMNDRDRLKDARLDKNLDDVQRDPPPWEVPAPELQDPNLRPPSIVQQP
ncbi:Serine/threonine-protein kinase ATG1 [Grifola frondosa]|uniref:non-specific serine/threonine protein kinase n=1 Tax=Grifola frondosa TaxID=5627 RepID=A0A1C7MHM2_GRIFR|nr:Serine/threonine-protein kinase ATG1 [Grifola frondosa]